MPAPFSRLLFIWPKEAIAASQNRAFGPADPMRPVYSQALVIVFFPCCSSSCWCIAVTNSSRDSIKTLLNSPLSNFFATPIAFAIPTAFSRRHFTQPAPLYALIARFAPASLGAAHTAVRWYTNNSACFPRSSAPLHGTCDRLPLRMPFPRLAHQRQAGAETLSARAFHKALAVCHPFLVLGTK